MYIASAVRLGKEGGYGDHPDRIVGRVRNRKLGACRKLVHYSYGDDPKTFYGRGRKSLPEDERARNCSCRNYRDDDGASSIAETFRRYVRPKLPSKSILSTAILFAIMEVVILGRINPIRTLEVRNILIQLSRANITSSSTYGRLAVFSHCPSIVLAPVIRQILHSSCFKQLSGNSLFDSVELL